MSQVSVTGWVGSQRLAIGGPDGVEIGGLGPGRAYKSRLGPIGVRRAGRREQSDIRALRVDRLAIILEDNIVDLAALEIDRAADAWRVDDHAGARRKRRAHSLRLTVAWVGALGAPGRDAVAGRGASGDVGRSARLRLARRAADCWPASAPDAGADTGGRRRNIASRPSPGPTARSRERGSCVSSDFILACLCLSASSRPIRARDRPRRGAGRRGRRCGHHRRARRSGGPAPRAGPSARSRDRPPPQEAAAARNASFSRLRTRLRSTAPPTLWSP